MNDQPYRGTERDLKAALKQKDEFIAVMLAGTLDGELRDRVHVLEAALAKTEERRSHYEDLAAERGRSLDQDERELCDLRARLAAAEGDVRALTEERNDLRLAQAGTLDVQLVLDDRRGLTQENDARS